ncbi:hypothetical protein, partial [Nostoc edaphicum]|uniref:hypothetical protein n=1 Tax=Nostoc edaphicum TaxID=264686 RepID=UPI003908159D
MAFSTAHISTIRGRPPGLVAGIKGFGSGKESMLYSSLSMVLYVRIYSLCPESFFYSTRNFSNILLDLS